MKNTFVSTNVVQHMTCPGHAVHYWCECSIILQLFKGRFRVGFRSCVLLLRALISFPSFIVSRGFSLCLKPAGVVQHHMHFTRWPPIGEELLMLGRHGADLSSHCGSGWWNPAQQAHRRDSVRTCVLLLKVFSASMTAGRKRLIPLLDERIIRFDSEILETEKRSRQTFYKTN